MIEPGNHTAWCDSSGDVWVRVDEAPGMFGCWWPICVGPGWEPQARGQLGQAREWDLVEEYGPFSEADEETAAAAVERVLRAVTA